MILFFVNGLFTVENNNYFMYFLTHIKQSSSGYKLIIKRQDNDTIVNETNINDDKDVQLLKIQINDDNIGDYQRYKYDIVDNNNESVTMSGSFPIIKTTYTDNLIYSFVSCNDNLVDKIPSWNKYAVPCTSKGWQEIADKKTDIIIHMGCY